MTFGLPSNTVMFFSNFVYRPGTFGVEIVELESNIWDNQCFSVPVPLFVTSWTCSGQPLRASEMLRLSEGQAFVAPEALHSPKNVSDHVGGPQALILS